MLSWASQAEKTILPARPLAPRLRAAPMQERRASKPTSGMLWTPLSGDLTEVCVMRPWCVHLAALLSVSLVVLASCGGAAPPSVTASKPSTAPVVSAAAPGSAAGSQAAVAKLPPASSAGASLARPSASAQATKLTLAYSPPTAYSAPAYAALDEGILKKHGLDAELVSLDSATLVQAVVSGSVPFGLGSTVNALNAVASGANIKAVASVNNASGIVMISKPGIKSVADLRGQTVAVAQPLSSSDFVTRLILQQNGLVYNKDVKILPAGNAPAQAAALVSGQVAAIAQTGDVAVALQAQGFKLLVNFPRQHVPFNEETLLVNGAYAAAHRDIVLAMIKAVWEGTRAVLGSYDVYTRVARKHLSNVSEDQLKGNYDFMRLVWADPANPRVTPESLKTITDLLAPSNPKIATVKYTDFVDASYIAKLKADGYFAGGGCGGC